MFKLYFTYSEHLDNISVKSHIDIQMYEIINIFSGNTF